MGMTGRARRDQTAGFSRGRFDLRLTFLLRCLGGSATAWGMVAFSLFLMIGVSFIFLLVLRLSSSGGRVILCRASFCEPRRSFSARWSESPGSGRVGRHTQWRCSPPVPPSRASVGRAGVAVLRKPRGGRRLNNGWRSECGRPWITEALRLHNPAMQV